MTFPTLLLALAQVLTHDDYVARLERFDALIAEGNIEAVRLEAQDLRGASYDSGALRLSIDDALVLSLQKLPDGSPALTERSRLRATIQGLTAAFDADGRASDPQLAHQIRQSWDQTFASSSTRLPGLEAPRVPGLIPDWVYDQWVRFVKWIETWWPEEQKPGVKRAIGASGIAGLIAAGALFVVVTLAWLAFRKRGVAPVTEPSIVLTAEKDDDPTARESDEWIAHATALERQGQMREALRAWYHAALAALISRGLVVYAKGRTNWEYVAAVSPKAPFKTGLTNATLRFEQCWYGGVPATREMLAQHRAEVLRCLEGIGPGAPA